MSMQDRLRTGLRGVEIDDRLEFAGVAVGVSLVLIGLATLLGTPWSHGGGVAVAALQIVGSLATVAIGAGLVWLTQTQR